MKSFKTINILTIFSMLVIIVVMSVPAYSEWYEDPVSDVNDDKYGINDIFSHLADPTISS